MSHYTVLVITEDGDYEKALAPFDENIEVEPYVSVSRAQIIERYKKDCERYKDKEDKTYFMEKWGGFDLSNDEVVENYRKYWEDDDTKFDEEGNELSTYNPNSKWDWYSLGGRWCGSMKLKENCEGIKESEPSLMSLMMEGPSAFGENNRTDFAQFKDVDLEYPEGDDAEKLARFWEINVEGSPKTLEEEQDSFYEAWYKPEYYLEEYGDKETYIYDQTHFRTYAVLYKGEWFEPGEMGWFGCSSADSNGYKEYREVFKKIISELKPDDYLAVVDCHI